MVEEVTITEVQLFGATTVELDGPHFLAQPNERDR